MLLVFDIANTNIKIGMFEGDKLKATWRISTGVQRMADEYAVMLLNLLREEGIDPKDIKEGAMSCVVPPLVTTFNELFQRYFKIKPTVVGPGLSISAEALYTRTAALPRVELARPKKAIGNNTQAAMQSGLIFGWAGLIEGIVGRIQAELGEKATVVATGGYAGIIAKETKAIDEVNPNLTTLGVKIIHDLT